MNYDEKRVNTESAEVVQEKNRSWWTNQTMSYDWKDRSSLEKFSPEWFEDIDRRFLHAARLYSDAGNPFEELMEVASLRGKRVLEIGCGMGFHSEMLVEAGASLCAVDLSPTSVTATLKRFEQKGIHADVRQMDAEALDFPSASFDLVWSWGVIHHSSRTGRIVREIERVLRPGGTSRIMVYNLEGMPAYITLATRYLTGFWSRKSLDELLWRSTDGFSARFYTKDGFADLLKTFFPEVELRVLGQDADVVPLPRFFRRPILGLLPLSYQRSAVRRRGAFIFAVARKHAEMSS